MCDGHMISRSNIEDTCVIDNSQSLALGHPSDLVIAPLKCLCIIQLRVFFRGISITHAVDISKHMSHLHCRM